jgi:hypothetical protein
MLRYTYIGCLCYEIRLLTGDSISWTQRTVKLQGVCNLLSIWFPYLQAQILDVSCLALLAHIGVTGMSIHKCRSRCPRHLRRGSVAACMLGLGGSNPAGGMDVCQWQALCVVRYRSLQRDDHSSRRFVPSVISKHQQWGDLGRRELSNIEKKILQDNPREITWWTVATVGGKPKCSHWEPA